MSRPRRVRITGDLFHPRVPEGAVRVTRPTRWGNPFKVVPGERTAEQAVAMYRRHLAEHPELVERARRELAGRDLACWCPPGATCHADVLLDVANATDPPGRERGPRA